MAVISTPVEEVSPKRQALKKWSLFGLRLLILVAVIYAAVKIIESRHATPAQNSQLSAKVVSLAKAGNCQDGLNQLNKVNAGKYDNSTRSKVLVYQLLCYADKDPNKALAAGRKLEDIYKKEGNNIDKNQQQYVEAVMQGIQNTQQAGSNAK